MTAIQKRPADLQQTTVLFDATSSMQLVWDGAEKAINEILGNLQNDGSLARVLEFKDEAHEIIGFGETDLDPDWAYEPRSRSTPLYKVIAEAIEFSIEESLKTPEIFVHHSFIIVTDGRSEKESASDLKRAKDLMARKDIQTTFILLDFSKNGDAGAPLGLKGIHMRRDNETLIDGAKAVVEAMRQMAENACTGVDPDSEILLLTE